MHEEDESASTFYSQGCKRKCTIDGLWPLITGWLNQLKILIQVTIFKFLNGVPLIL